jgi:branched-chain amino acid transport system substrate-binding protein
MIASKRPFQFAVLLVTVLALMFAVGGGSSATLAQQATKPASDSPVLVMMNLPEKKADGEPIPVGAIFDLTGATAEVSKPYSEGVIAYVDWLNNHGGIGGRPVKLVSADYAYKVDTAQQLYTQFVSNDKVLVFSGWGTGDTDALRTKIAEDMIPFVSASYAASLNDPKEAPYNFLVGTTYSDQALILLNYMASQYKDGKPKIAFVHNDSPFGTSPLGDSEAFLKSAGIDSIRIPMPRGATDYTAQITQVKNFGATHVLFQNTSAPAATFINQATSQNLKVVFGCLNWCADEILQTLAKTNADGVYGAIPFAPPSLDVPGVQFVRQYTKAKNVDLDAKGLHYVQGWWSMAILLEGIKRTVDAKKPLTGENIKASLESIKDFDTGGVTSPITFTATDHAGNKAMRVYQSKGGKWVAVTEYLTAPKVTK